MTPLAAQFMDEAGAVAALSPSPRPKVAEIQQAVCAHYELRPIDMQSERRSRSVAQPRQIAMYLANRLTTRSLPEIGRLFGGRDHSTVIWAVKRVTERLADPNDEAAADIAAICVDIALRVGARRMIEEKTAADVADYLRTGQLQQSRRAG